MHWISHRDIVRLENATKSRLKYLNSDLKNKFLGSYHGKFKESSKLKSSIHNIHHLPYSCIPYHGTKFSTKLVLEYGVYTDTY